MAIATFIKDPAAKLDYEIDWSDWLVGDTIATSTWVVPTGITKVTDSSTVVIATIRLSGGTHGVDYECVNHIITASGQEDERSIVIEVRQVEAGASADASDRANAVSVLNDWVQVDIAPTLEQTEVETILDRCRRASTWTSSTAYVPGDMVLPTVRTGHKYKCLIGGTSGTTEPYTGSDRWPTSKEATFSEGDSDPQLTWVEDGPEYPNIYDLRLAAYECWDLKVRKATQFIQTGDLHFEQVYQHCRAMRDEFTPMFIA